ncbi:hypothetical protein [Pseudoclavibacter sp. JSM 162008]|uniref:hypothetical protein n=1 Tax=Pseudoclavibacter sp. JSM 162008 TaxID=3229855 RepID=UPI003524917A
MNRHVAIIGSELILGALPYLAVALASISILVTERSSARAPRDARRATKGQKP